MVSTTEVVFISYDSSSYVTEMLPLIVLQMAESLGHISMAFIAFQC